ncbi:MAG TPA: SRPBCC family protein [Acidimicrobiia bacterium]|nr:SRPBCC family protein [Acidimicrobiia bacterium]
MLLSAAASAEVVLLWLGRAYGSTARERAEALPGDDIVARPQVVTDHAITIDAPPQAVWPWLVQMGWHRGGWYTARWVDRLLFPANWASADQIVPELQHCAIGDFIPDGAPETACGFIVEHVEPNRALVLHSTSHLPAEWREAHRASLDWSWAFVLQPLDDGRRTRFHFRSRWSTAPWWLTLGGRFVIVPADFIMSRDMLHGVKHRAETFSRDRAVS